MEKTCGNCRFWNKWGGIINHFEIGKCTMHEIRVLEHMSCPQFDTKEPEIPAKLLDWKPEWHPASEPPNTSREVLVADYLYWTAHFKEGKWFNFEMGRAIQADIKWWTELP